MAYIRDNNGRCRKQKQEDNTDSYCVEILLVCFAVASATGIIIGSIANMIGAL